MADQRKGGIAWTETTWNPLRGCLRVSEGCRNCYAEKVAARFSGIGQPYEGLVTIGEKGPRWNGTVRFVPEKLDEPLRWTKPRRVFVNSMSDLFHDGVTNEQIAAIFGVMAASPRHTFQVLTKRPERMREWFRLLLSQTGNPVRACVVAARENGCDIGWPLAGIHPLHWPLPNVWLGVSVEDQASADDRIPLLLETPAAVRWVSYEPAIGPVDFEGLTLDDGSNLSAFRVNDDEDGIDWIVVGGESGPGARPFDLAWARSVVEQAKDTGCRVFVKQLGSNPNPGIVAGVAPGARFRDRKGGNPNEWPEDLRVREWPEVRR